MGELFDEDYAYTQIARRLFNEFLELKLRVEGLIDPEKHEKDIEHYRKANKELKLTLESLRHENEVFAAELEKVERDRDALRLELNEALIKVNLIERFNRQAKEHNGVPFDQLMTEDSYREWVKLLTEIPRGG